MSQAFYEKVLGLFFRAIIILVLFLSSIQCLLLSSGQGPLYYAYAPLFVFACAYALDTFLKFRDFKQNLSLYLPTCDKTVPLELHMENQELMLKIALLYANGQPYHKIAKAFKLRNQNEARRLVYQGLAFLLKFYDEYKEKEGARA
jgi:hypothetical protein